MSDQLKLAARSYYEQPSVYSIQTIPAFESGAEWQRRQYNRILVLAFNAANELDKRGACSLADHIKTELERLQD